MCLKKYHAFFSIRCKSMRSQFLVYKFHPNIHKMSTYAQPISSTHIYQSKYIYPILSKYIIIYPNIPVSIIFWGGGMPISRVHTLDVLENRFFFPSGSPIQSLENRISVDVPPQKNVYVFSIRCQHMRSQFLVSTIFEKSLVGCMCPETLTRSYCVCFGVVLIAKQMEPLFIFSTNHSPVLGNSKICLIRWLGWCMLVPVNGPALMPYHSLELSLKGTNIP